MPSLVFSFGQLISLFFLCDIKPLLSPNNILVIDQPRADERGHHAKSLERKKVGTKNQI